MLLATENMQIKPNPTIQDYNEDYKEEVNHKRPKYLKPEFVESSDYKNPMEIIKAFPHLKSLNESDGLDIQQIGDSYSFILRSNNDDDIHKAIKYGIWSSTPFNNDTLSEIYKKAQLENKEIYLFYSVVKSGQFVGVARMKSDVQEETFSYWWQHSKWRSNFSIEWVYIKDITYKFFENLINCKNDPVIRSKDGTQIDWETVIINKPQPQPNYNNIQTGKKMLQIFKDAPKDQSIFNDFEHMDQREQYLRQQRNNNNYHQYYQQQNYYQQAYQMQQYYGGQYQQMMPMYPQYQYQQQKLNNIYPPTQNFQPKSNYQGRKQYAQPVVKK